MPSLNQMVVLLVAVLILIVGLTNPGGISDHGAKEKLLQQGMVRSEKERVTTPDVNEAELAELVASTSAFAFDLYQAIRESDSNLFYSPYSISLALAMTYAGAREVTQQQMADTLHFALEYAFTSRGPHDGDAYLRMKPSTSPADSMKPATNCCMVSVTSAPVSGCTNRNRPAALIKRIGGRGIPRPISTSGQTVAASTKGFRFSTACSMMMFPL